MWQALDIAGHKFGKLTVLYRIENSSDRKSRWVCKCECGKESIVQGKSLRRGNTKSCGCLLVEIRGKATITHGLRRRPEYKTWCNMKQRCYNEKRKDYQYYGGRGIKICDRWLDSFENFYTDMGPRPSIDLSIDRLDVDGNYEPENCKWATCAEQLRNRRCNKTNEGVIHE